MKAVKKVTPVAPADAEKQLKTFIDKFEPKNQTLIERCAKHCESGCPRRTNWYTTTTISS